jgi:ElaB/YqjD/DUF883 family membrane-anchored ribosome-binding protein
MNVPLAIADSGGRGAGRSQVDELFNEVDDLIKRVADVDSPEILRVRARVHAALVVAKSAFADGAHRIRERPTPVFKSLPMFDEVPDDHDTLPAENLGVALLVGLGLGLVASWRHIDAG